MRFEDTLPVKGVTAIRVPCGSLVLMHRWLDLAFYAECSLTSLPPLGCFRNSIKSRIHCCHLCGKRVPGTSAPSLSPPPRLSFLELGPGVEGWQERFSSTGLRRQDSSLNDLLEERFGSSSAIRNVKKGS